MPSRKNSLKRNPDYNKNSYEQPQIPVLMDMVGVQNQIKSFFDQLVPIMDQVTTIMKDFNQNHYLVPEKEDTVNKVKKKKKLETSGMQATQNFAESYMDLWVKMYHDTHDVMHQFNPVPLVNKPIEMHKSMPLTIFDPHIMMETFREAFDEISNQPQDVTQIIESYTHQLQDIMKNLQARFKGEDWEIIVTPKLSDRRFKDDLWVSNPWAHFFKEVYLSSCYHLEECVDKIKGLNPKTAQKLKFYTQQILDALSPANFPFLNPVVMDEIQKTGGQNLYKGWLNYLSDLDQTKGLLNIKMTDLKAFKVGENLATTPGKVVFQNELFQLIQYEPTTQSVYKIPLLIIPPWINKFYIFDLKSENSFVRWALDAGFTVFIMSWVNPKGRLNKQKSKDFTLSDYVTHGALKALEKVRIITGEDKANIIGYCSGGILMHCMLSYLEDQKKSWVNCATAMATPGDTKLAGDLLVYICEKQLDRLEQHISQTGYLDGQAMVTSFNLLRSNDLIWSFFVNNYLLGKDPFPFDLLYWNCDASNMPAMHPEYLKKIFHDNCLIKPGGIKVGKRGVDLRKIKTPMFVVAAIEDHIVPWKSVYPMSQLYEGPVKFVLSASGHVAGMMNHPAKQKYNYWVNSHQSKNPDEWIENAAKVPGSWWIEWKSWIDQFNKEQVNARQIDKNLIIQDAPGSYVIE